MKWLGDCSYSVYLMHVLVLSVGGFIARRYGVNPYLMFIVCAVAIAVGSWLSYEWVEKRSYRWLKARIDGERYAYRSRIFPDKNTRTLSGAMIGVNCAQACEEFP
jgi:peptidoglycan/LPS O-acetylase OafA/YrhL